MSDELNDKQRRFVDEYMLDLNAKQAAIRAGYSEITAQQQGSRLLCNVKVADEIERLKGARSLRTKTDADWLLNRLTNEVEADLADIMADDGIKPIMDWPPIWRKGLVCGIDIEQIFEGSGRDRKHIGQIVKVKLSDRVKRLELIGKHVGVQAFKEKVEHDTSDPLSNLLREISGRSVSPKE